MIILVGVTVAIAINGGLFTRAEEARYKTQVEIDRETLLSEVAGAYDIQTGHINFEVLNEGIKGIEFTGEDGEYTSKSGNKFYVNETSGIITLATE